MYVVAYTHRKGLKVKTPEGEYETRKPGEAVPEADAWKGNVLQAHVSIGQIQTEEQYNATVSKYAEQQRQIDLRRATRPKPAAKPPVVEEPAQVEAAAPEALEEAEEEGDLESLVEGEHDLNSMKKDDLMDLAKSRGIKVRGTKSEIINRLQEAS